MISQTLPTQCPPVIHSSTFSEKEPQTKLSLQNAQLDLIHKHLPPLHLCIGPFPPGDTYTCTQCTNTLYIPTITDTPVLHVSTAIEHILIHIFSLHTYTHAHKYDIFRSLSDIYTQTKQM